MLCDRRRENKNCLALVSSKVIYFQKLTESHCRGFIYFYSECHYSVMPGTWAHNEVYSYELECGRCLLTCRLSSRRGWGCFSGMWWWVGTWYWCLGKCPCLTMDCPADMSSQALDLSTWEGACVLLPDQLSSLCWSKKKKKVVGLQVSLFFSSGTLLEFLETQKLRLQMSLLWIYLLFLFKLSGRFSHPNNLHKTIQFFFVFFSLSSFLYSFYFSFFLKCLQRAVRMEGSKVMLSSWCNDQAFHWGSPFGTCDSGILRTLPFFFLFSLLLVPFKKWDCSVSSWRCCL